MDGRRVFVLVHSPLVGPLTWRLVQEEMERRGVEAAVPSLNDVNDVEQPFWRQHAASFADGLAGIGQDRRLVLVAHSGAGPILPALRQATPHVVDAYIFVDAGIPRPAASRLDLMALQDAVWTETFGRSLQTGDRFPTWREDDLIGEIPDPELRRQLVAEINPRALAFFAEPLPVFDGWPDVGCGYIKFTASYAWDFVQAQADGWPVSEVDAGHFHMLVDPGAVTDEIMRLVNEIG